MATVGQKGLGPRGKTRERRRDAGEIIVLADTRRAELEREEKAQRPKHTGVSNPGGNPLPKSQLVAESKRAPLLKLPEQDRKAYFDKCREALVPPTSAGAAALAKLPGRASLSCSRGVGKRQCGARVRAR